MLSFKQLGGLSFLITLTVLFTQYLLESKDYRISIILNEIVLFLDSLDETVTRAEKLSQEDPYNDLIEQVRPAYEKISSIKKQTEIYEKMERIAGGPTNFMSTSLEALESIARIVPGIEKQYRLIVAGNKKQIGILQDEYKRSLQGLDTVFDDKSLEELEKIGIVLSEPSELFAESKTIGLESIKEKISNLAEQFALLESLQQQQSRMESDGEAVDDQLKQQISKLIKEVTEIITSDEQFFRSIMPKIGEKWRQLESAVSKIGEHQTFVKTRYEQLGDQLDSDIIRTRERINSLKYPKKNEEL